MNKRRSTASKRCPRCKIHQTLCFCDAIESLETQTRVSIIMHHRETYLTSNTANLAKMVLPQCEIYKRGLQEIPFRVVDMNIKEDEIPLYLFPHEGAIELNEDFMKKHEGKKFHLIVPDGSWSQAVKFYRREKDLAHVQCVTIPAGVPGRYRLRKSNNENKLSTYEAITRALSILENSQELQTKMEVIFDTMVERVIRGRTAFEN